MRLVYTLVAIVSAVGVGGGVGSGPCLRREESQPPAQSGPGSGQHHGGDQEPGPASPSIDT